MKQILGTGWCVFSEHMSNVINDQHLAAIIVCVESIMIFLANVQSKSNSQQSANVIYFKDLFALMVYSNVHDFCCI